MKCIQIFGLQCSGTNILTRLLRANTDVLVSDTKYGSKHGVARSIKWSEIERDKDDVVFVHIYKNIYSWIISMRNSPHEAFPHSLGVKRAMTTQWAPEDGITFPNILKMRESVFGSFVRIKDSVPNWTNVRYEDFLRNPGGCISSIVGHNNVNLALLSQNKGRGSPWRRTPYYLKQKYMDYFTPELLRLVDELYDRRNEELLCA